MLAWQHPSLARLPCDLCEQYERDGEGLRLEWDAAQRLDLPVLREPHDKPVCWACEKVPERVRQREQRLTTRSHAVELTPRNKLVWEHYQECRAVGCFPSDPIVYRHARIIARVQDAWHQHQITDRLDALITVFTALRAR